MSDSLYRALVVDDEPIARRTVMWALSNEGFNCTPATDGDDALEKAKHTQYDLVVTDLRMPNKHGHQLVTELLAGATDYIPVMVVHSSVDEPRLIKDLMLRGIDDVVLKPTNYAAFAAKFKGLVIRRRSIRQESLTIGNEVQSDLIKMPEENLESKVSKLMAPISIKDFEARLRDVAHILPVSNKSMEVLKLLNTSDFDARSLANVVGSDAVLTVELLRNANCGQYTRTGSRITDLNEVIVRLGAKRLGEIALAIGALDSLTKLVLPWFDKKLASRRSLAGCVATKRILELQGAQVNNSGVCFSALVFPLTRLVVGSAYANVYEVLLTESVRKKTSLRSLEREVFPRTPAEATAEILLHWGLSRELCLPLRQADVGPESLLALNEPTRTSVTLLKSAILLGEHAVGNWQPWEEKPALPSDSFFRSLKIDNVLGFIDEVRSDLER